MPASKTPANTEGDSSACDTKSGSTKSNSSSSSTSSSQSSKTSTPADSKPVTPLTNFSEIPRVSSVTAPVLSVATTTDIPPVTTSITSATTTSRLSQEIPCVNNPNFTTGKDTFETTTIPASAASITATTTTTTSITITTTTTVPSHPVLAVSAPKKQSSLNSQSSKSSSASSSTTSTSSSSKSHTSHSHSSSKTKSGSSSSTGTTGSTETAPKEPQKESQGEPVIVAQASVQKQEPSQPEKSQSRSLIVEHPESKSQVTSESKPSAEDKTTKKIRNKNKNKKKKNKKDSKSAGSKSTKSTEEGQEVDNSSKTSTVASALALTKSNISEAIKLHMKDVLSLFEILDPKQTGVIDAFQHLPLVTRALGLSDPPERLVKAICESNGNNLFSLSHIQEIISHCCLQSSNVDVLNRWLHHIVEHQEYHSLHGFMRISELTYLLSTYCQLRPSVITAACNECLLTSLTSQQTTESLVNTSKVIATLIQPTNPTIFHSLLRAFRPEPIAYMKSFLGLPLGFRESSLFQLLGPMPSSTETYTTPFMYTLEECITPRPFSISLNSITDTKKIELDGSMAIMISLEHAKGVPLPGLGTQILGRYARICLYSKSEQNSRSYRNSVTPLPWSNITTLDAKWDFNSEDEWQFVGENKTLLIRLPLPVTAEQYLFIELNILTQRNELRNNASYGQHPIRTLPSQAGEAGTLSSAAAAAAPLLMMSCGWAEVDIGSYALSVMNSSTAQKGSHKITRNLPIWAGTPYDKQEFSAEDIHARREGIRKLGNIMSRGKPKPVLKVTLRKPPNEEQVMLYTLPSPVICPSFMAPYISLYRQLLKSSAQTGISGLLQHFAVLTNEEEWFSLIFLPLFKIHERRHQKQQRLSTKSEKLTLAQIREEIFMDVLRDLWSGLFYTRIVSEVTVLEYLKTEDVLRRCSDADTYKAFRKLIQDFITIHASLATSVTVLTKISELSQTPFSVEELMTCNRLN